jgi:hypothetical protein
MLRVIILAGGWMSVSARKIVVLSRQRVEVKAAATLFIEIP